MKAALARFGASQPARAWKRYTQARGNILAAGVGYFAFFSIFPATALALTVFGFVLRGHPELFRSVLSDLSAYLPGLVKDAQHPDGLLRTQPPRALSLTITGVISFLTLVLGGLGWLAAVREGIRAVFGAPTSVGTLISNKLRDLGVLFSLGLGIALLAVLTSVVGAAAGRIAQVAGMSGQGWVVLGAGLALSVLADTALMLVLLRVVSEVKVPWRELFHGALVGGLGLSVLKISAGALLPRLTANPLFASFAIVVGLLVWLNLISRLVLVSAAWAANDVGSQMPGDDLVPQVVGSAGPSAVRDGSLPSFSVRSGDRTTLGSGFVLGAATMTGVAALARALRSAGRLARG